MSEHQTPLIGAHLMLIKNNQILLMERKGDALNGLYSFVSGHIDKDETAIEALIRETYEEANIKLSIQDLKFVTVLHQVNTTYKGVIKDIVSFFWAAENFEGEIKNNEPDRCAKLEFYNLDNLPCPLSLHTKKAIEAYFSGEKYVEIK